MPRGLLSLGRQPFTQWSVINIGGGGQIRGLDIALDGTIVIKTDVGGGYVKDTRSGVTQWYQLVTLATMPAGTWSPLNGYGGLWEVAIAPSNSNRIFFNFNGLTYVSNNKGLGCVLTSVPQLDGYFGGGNTDPNGPYAFTNQKIIIDPNNSDVVYVATNNNGIQVSFDGGVTAAAVAGITASTAGPGGAGLAFDTNSGTVTVSGQTRTKTIYIPSYGNGIWQSTNGGVSWSQIANGTNSPLQVFNAKISPDGVYYCSDASGVFGLKVWRWQSGAWTTIFTDGGSFYAALATDPNIAGRLIISAAGSGGKSGHETLDYGATFVGADTWAPNYPATPDRNNVSTLIPWLATSDNGFMTVGDFKIDPSVPVFNVTGNTSTASKTITNVSNMTGLAVGQYVVANGNFGINSPIVSLNAGASTITIADFPTATATGTALKINLPNLWFAEGIGPWKTNWPVTFSGFHWIADAVGIEELVCNDVVAPIGGYPLLGSWDRGVFQTVNNQFPSAYGSVDAQFSAGWAIDYASNDPSFIAAIINWDGAEVSGFSTAYGAPGTWTVFATYPVVTKGGAIAVASSTNIVLIPSNNSVPYYTTDQGANWSICQLSTGGALPGDGWLNAYYLNAHPVVADRVNVGVFYMHNWVHGLYKSIDGGATWKLMDNTVFVGDGSNVKMRSTPGIAGDMWFTVGNIGNPSHPVAGSYLYHFVDSAPLTLGGSITITHATNVLEPQTLGIGKGAPGGPGYSLFITGWVSNVFSNWRSDDIGLTWTNLGANPNGNIDAIGTLNGDMNTYGTCYGGFAGTGWFKGQLG